MNDSDSFLEFNALQTLSFCWRGKIVHLYAPNSPYDATGKIAKHFYLPREPSDSKNYSLRLRLFLRRRRNAR